MSEVNNVKNQTDPIVHEVNTDTSFATEQNNDACLQKCFEHATKVDFHQTKIDRLQFYLMDGILF